MEVEFRRTGARRYSVTVYREDLPPFEFGGPGYDPLMPHDLQHMIVESELGLRRGIFGFLAAGGEAGGAAQLAPGEGKRIAARRRARASRRDERMLRQGGRSDGTASERAAFVCWYEWLRRSNDPERRKRAAAMADEVRHAIAGMPKPEREALTEEFLARVCARMDEWSARWARLEVGKAIRVRWTVHEGRRAQAHMKASQPGPS